MKKVAFGESYIINSGGRVSVHAEHDALNNLISSNSITPRKNIDLFVFRLSTKNVRGSSRPCYHCIQRLTHAYMRFGINIKNVYYTTPNGEIAKEKFISMIESDNNYISTGNRIGARIALLQLKNNKKTDGINKITWGEKKPKIKKSKI